MLSEWYASVMFSSLMSPPVEAMFQLFLVFLAVFGLFYAVIRGGRKHRNE